MAKGKTGAKVKSAREKQAKASASKKAAKAKSPVKDRIVKLASDPAVAEIVAATLVAAAAAIRDPKKARQLAEASGEELTDAAQDAAGKGGAFWQLAMDVAKRSVNALGSGKTGGKKKKKKNAKGSKKKSPAAGL
jgi:hypothetical protein